MGGGLGGTYRLRSFVAVLTVHLVRFHTAHRTDVRICRIRLSEKTLVPHCCSVATGGRIVRRVTRCGHTFTALVTRL